MKCSLTAYAVCMCVHMCRLIGWVVIDLAMAYKQLSLTGSVSPAMILVCGFQVGGNCVHLFFCSRVGGIKWLLVGFGRDFPGCLITL